MTPKDPQRRPPEPRQTSLPEPPSPSKSVEQTRATCTMNSSTVLGQALLAAPSELHQMQRYRLCSRQPAAVGRHCPSLYCPSSCPLPRFDPKCPCSTMRAYRRQWPWAHPRHLLPIQVATATITRSFQTIPISTAKRKKVVRRLADAERSRPPSRRVWSCSNRSDNPASRIFLPC